MAVSVRISNLRKAFASTIAIDDVSLQIEPGELFFLLGPSGCGKTTLLRCIAGFCEPDEGTILLGDQDITGMPPHRRDTGMVFQSYALWPHMSVAENVAFGLEMRDVRPDERKARVAEALAMVQMTDRASRKPNQLSGGQQQRVALARALVIRPRCLLLDEPLSNLDAKLRLEMRTEIRRICKDAGLTAVYVTHDQKEALSIADRLAVLNDGKVCQCGTPREVYLQPASRFVAHFIGETNFIDGRAVSVNGDRIVVETGIGRIESAARAADGPWREGQAVTVSIRPEMIVIGDPPAGTPNAFDAAVHDTEYLGEVAQHLARVGGMELKAFEMNPRLVARDKQVENTRIWFDPRNVVLLASESTRSPAALNVTADRVYDIRTT